MAHDYSPEDLITLVTNDMKKFVLYGATLKSKFNLIEDLLLEFGDSFVEKEIFIDIDHESFIHLLFFTDTLKSPQVKDTTQKGLECCNEEWRRLITSADLMGLKECYVELLISKIHQYVTNQHKIKVYTGLIGKKGEKYEILNLREYLHKLDDPTFLTEKEKEIKTQQENNAILQGPRGSVGPQGPRGSVGPQGSVGP